MYCGSCLEVLKRNPIMFRYMFFQLITGYNTRLTLTLDMSLQKASIGNNITPLLGPKILGSQDQTLREPPVGKGSLKRSNCRKIILFSFFC